MRVCRALRQLAVRVLPLSRTRRCVVIVLPTIGIRMDLPPHGWCRERRLLPLSFLRELIAIIRSSIRVNMLAPAARKASWLRRSSWRIISFMIIDSIFANGLDHPLRCSSSWGHSSTSCGCNIKCFWLLHRVGNVTISSSSVNGLHALI